MGIPNSRESCHDEESHRFVFACSGASDVGQIADLAARQLNADKAGKMLCLAGIGGRLVGMMTTVMTAKSILAIDGCSLDCAQKTLEFAGFTQFEHLCLADLGMEKGRTPATPENIAAVVRQSKIQWTVGEV